MSFGDLSSELAGYIPGLSGYLADDFVRRAWRKIRDARQWSFLITDDSVVCPAGLTAGSYSISQFNNQVTANATASAAFLALPFSVVPAQLIQIRFRVGTTYSQIYNITDLDQSTPTAIVLTLDKVVTEPTNATSNYLVYRPYIVAPTADFLRWLSFVDMASSFQVMQDFTSTQLDRKDAGRQLLGTAYYLASYKESNATVDNPPVPIYELWPGPSTGQTFYVRYRRRGIDFVDPTDEQPAMIPDDLILQAAKGFYAYQWASENKGNFASLAGTDWLGLIADAKTTYLSMLQYTMKQDDTQMLQAITDHVSSVFEGPVSTGVGGTER